MDSKRAEFKELLYRPILESTTTAEDSIQLTADIRSWILRNIPNKLYRYRTCSEYAFSALDKDEIWGSAICTFNDPFECTPYFGVKELYDFLTQRIHAEQVAQVLRALQQHNAKTILDQLFPPETVEQIFSILPEEIDETYVQQNLNHFITAVVNFLYDNNTDVLKGMYSSIQIEQNRKNIACFSEVNDSSLMWGHYAASHQGFCIEYNFQPVVKQCEIKCGNPLYCQNLMLSPSLAPVIYSDTKYNAFLALATPITQQIALSSGISLQPFYDDILFITKTLLTKSSDWSYEKEWRMFSPPSENIALHKKITEQAPTAVYLGARMKTEDEERVVAICKDKRIPLFKMIPNYISQAYQLSSVPYEQFQEFT